MKAKKKIKPVWSFLVKPVEFMDNYSDKTLSGLSRRTRYEIRCAIEDRQNYIWATVYDCVVLKLLRTGWRKNGN